MTYEFTSSKLCIAGSRAYHYDQSFVTKKKS